MLGNQAVLDHSVKGEIRCAVCALLNDTTMPILIIETNSLSPKSLLRVSTPPNTRQITTTTTTTTPTTTLVPSDPRFPPCHPFDSLAPFCHSISIFFFWSPRPSRARLWPFFLFSLPFCAAFFFLPFLLFFLPSFRIYLFSKQFFWAILVLDPFLCSLFISWRWDTDCLSFWPLHYGTKPGYFETSPHSLSHLLRCEGVSEQTNERSRARKQSKQCGASTWVSGVSDQVNRQAQYLRHDSWLFWTTVQGKGWQSRRWQMKSLKMSHHGLLRNGQMNRPFLLLTYDIDSFESSISFSRENKAIFSCLAKQN